MKKAFTLIELIIVITIIGVLSVIALSKFFDSHDGSEISNDVRVSISIQLAINAQNLVPSTYLTLVDLEGKYSSNEVTLNDLITIDGQNWNLRAGGNVISYDDIHLESEDKEIITLELHKDRRVTLMVHCDKYSNKLYKKKCLALSPNKISTLSF